MAVGLRRGDGRNAVFVLEVGPETRAFERYRAVVGHAPALVRASRFGGDDDGAVGGPRSVEGGGRGAFQHRDAFDVVRIEVGHGVAEVHRGVAVGVVGVGGGRRASAEDGHAVDDEQGFVAAVVERGVAAQGDAHRAAGAGACRGHGEAGHLAVHVGNPVGSHRGIDGIARYLRYGVSQRFLLAGQAQRRNHDIGDLGGGFFQGDVDRRAAADRDSLGFITQRLEDENGVVAVDSDRVTAVGFRRGTDRGALDDDGASYQRSFSVVVEHGAGDAAALSLCCQGPQEQSDRRKQRAYVLFGKHICYSFLGFVLASGRVG